LILKKLKKFTPNPDPVGSRSDTDENEHEDPNPDQDKVGSDPQHCLAAGSGEGRERRRGEKVRMLTHKARFPSTWSTAAVKYRCS